MSEPVYHSIRAFAEAYGFEYTEVNCMIGMGVITPRRSRGNSVLTETDLMKYVRWNTERRKKDRLMLEHKSVGDVWYTHCSK